MRSAVRSGIRSAMLPPPWWRLDPLRALFSDGQTLVFHFVDGRYATKSLVDGSIDYSTTPSDLMTVQRASPKWVYDETGTLVEVPVDTLAIQHDPVAGESLGALIEESRTNLLLWSEDFVQGAWAVSGAASLVSSNSDYAPDGLMTADVITSDGNPANYFRQSVSFTDSGQVFSDGIFLKSKGAAYADIRPVAVGGTTVDGGTARFAFNSESFTTIGPNINEVFFEKLAGGWYRISVSIEMNGTNDTRQIRLSADGELAVWGAQLEEGSTPSSYIPTTDSQATRAADNVSRVLDDEYDPNAGTYTIRAAVPPGETVATLGSVSVTSTSDEMTTYTLSYSSDPGATRLMLGNGLFESIEYTPGVS